MAKLVLGLFDDMDKAQRAIDALAAEGFGRDNVDLRSGAELIREGAAPASPEGGGFWDSIKHAFAGSSEGRLADGQAQAVREDDALIAVLTEDADAERAARIIDDNGAEDIDSRMNAGAATTAGSAAPGATGGEQRIPVAEEELRVGKRQVDSGGVRVRSRIIERPVEQDVALREERVEVERRPADRPAAVEGEGAFREQEFEVRARSEEPVVEKRARVKEEVTVKKESRQHQERVRDTVRSTDVQVEKLSPEEEREFARFAGEFQNDWQAKYAQRSGLQYQDVEPGYQYGYRLARSGRYGDTDWAAIEPQVRGDWEQRGYGPWEQFRDAVRSGWERAHK